MESNGLIKFNYKKKCKSFDDSVNHQTSNDDEDDKEGFIKSSCINNFMKMSSPAPKDEKNSTDDRKNIGSTCNASYQVNICKPDLKEKILPLKLKICKELKNELESVEIIINSSKEESLKSSFENDTDASSQSSLNDEMAPLEVAPPNSFLNKTLELNTSHSIETKFSDNTLDQVDDNIQEESDKSTSTVSCDNDDDFTTFEKRKDQATLISIAYEEDSLTDSILDKPLDRNTFPSIEAKIGSNMREQIDVNIQEQLDNSEAQESDIEESGNVQDSKKSNSNISYDNDKSSTPGETKDEEIVISDAYRKVLPPNSFLYKSIELNTLHSFEANISNSTDDQVDDNIQEDSNKSTSTIPYQNDEPSTLEESKVEETVISNDEEDSLPDSILDKALERNASHSMETKIASNIREQINENIQEQIDDHCIEENGNIQEDSNKSTPINSYDDNKCTTLEENKEEEIVKNASPLSPVFKENEGVLRVISKLPQFSVIKELTSSELEIQPTHTSIPSGCDESLSNTKNKFENCPELIEDNVSLCEPEMDILKDVQNNASSSLLDCINYAESDLRQNRIDSDRVAENNSTQMEQVMSSIPYLNNDDDENQANPKTKNNFNHLHTLSDIASHEMEKGRQHYNSDKISNENFENDDTSLSKSIPNSSTNFNTQPNHSDSLYLNMLNSSHSNHVEKIDNFFDEFQNISDSFQNESSNSFYSKYFTDFINDSSNMDIDFINESFCLDSNINNISNANVPPDIVSTNTFNPFSVDIECLESASNTCISFPDKKYFSSTPLSLPSNQMMAYETASVGQKVFVSKNQHRQCTNTLRPTTTLSSPQGKGVLSKTVAVTLSQSSQQKHLNIAPKVSSKLSPAICCYLSRQSVNAAPSLFVKPSISVSMIPAIPSMSVLSSCASSNNNIAKLQQLTNRIDPCSEPKRQALVLPNPPIVHHSTAVLPVNSPTSSTSPHANSLKAYRPISSKVPHALTLTPLVNSTLLTNGYQIATASLYPQNTPQPSIQLSPQSFTLTSAPRFYSSIDNGNTMLYQLNPAQHTFSSIMTANLLKK